MVLRHKLQELRPCRLRRLATMPSLKRTISISGKDRVVKHTWCKHPRGYTLTSVLLKAGSGTRRSGKGCAAVVEGEESAVEEIGREHAHTLKRRAEQRTSRTSSAAAAAAAAASTPARRRCNADAALSRSSPLATAMVAGSRRSGRDSPQAERPLVQTVSSTFQKCM